MNPVSNIISVTLGLALRVALAAGAVLLAGAIAGIDVSLREAAGAGVALVALAILVASITIQALENQQPPRLP